MTIAIGDKLPTGTFRVMTSDGPAPKTTDEIFSGKKVVLFAVPGAFTPTCHRNHLPGFLSHLDQMAEKGVDAVAVTAVNDVFVMDAWAKSSGGDGKIMFLSDGNADFARALGLEMDASGGGLGVRSRRYAMIVDDGVVSWFAVEEAPGKVDQASADSVFAAL
ncbi:MAG: peroxiredoxin [Salinarimonadaceae bacterium]|nr:MAG: peroxiredoxin [Salinarimonadaceae bacterium]